MELIEQLTSQLGVKEDQAKGGVGLLLKLAKDKLGADDYAKVAENIEGADEMAAAAPEASGGVGGLLSGLGASLGGQAGSLVSLGSGFSKLGLNKDMVGKFLPIVTSFLEKKGGSGVKDLLSKITG